MFSFSFLYKLYLYNAYESFFYFSDSWWAVERSFGRDWCGSKERKRKEKEEKAKEESE